VSGLVLGLVALPSKSVFHPTSKYCQAFGCWLGHQAGSLQSNGARDFAAGDDVRRARNSWIPSFSGCVYISHREGKYLLIWKCLNIQSVQAQVGWSFEQPDLVKDVPASGRGLGLGDL